MKVIQIVGYSGSGKTGFIERLIPLLRARGEVGVIKHLGEHAFILEEEKDTSRFYEKGADLSAGIDPEKMVMVARDNRLDHALDMFSDAGIDFAIVEGFKTIPYPRIVIGDLESEGCVLRNPVPEEVLRSLSIFTDHYTMGGLVKELKKEHKEGRAGAIVTFNGMVREWTGTERTEHLDFDDDLDRKIDGLREKMKGMPGVLGVRLYHRKGRIRAGEDITYFAVLAEHRRDALRAVTETLNEMKKEVHRGGLPV